MHPILLLHLDDTTDEDLSIDDVAVSTNLTATAADSNTTDSDTQNHPSTAAQRTDSKREMTTGNTLSQSKLILKLNTGWYVTCKWHHTI